jgi:NitT/TauT family transport system ATP-binding protein
MDEPFAALDEITRHRLNRDLLTLQADLDMSVIFVTHSVYESAFLSSRIAIFSPRPGRIVETITVAPTGARTEEFRRTPTYLEACGKAAHALELAMVGA